jgi:hypothetical protein
MIPLLEFAFSTTPPPFVPTLLSSALSPQQIETIFQPIIANILGYQTDPAPWGVSPNAAAWKAVRVGWQQEGQPAWGIGEDVCILTATITHDPFGEVRDGFYEQNDNGSLVDQMSFTQVWNMHFTVYGPNSYRNATMISSATALDWVHDALAAQSIYLANEPGHGLFPRPINNFENYQGQWWARVDLDLKFNYGVNESIIVPSAASVGITLIPQPGPTFRFTIQAN